MGSKRFLLRIVVFATLLFGLSFSVSGCSGGRADEGEASASQSASATAEPTLTSLTLSSTIIAGGTTGTGTVTLSGAAPAGGASVALSSSNTTLATVPASVVVPAGATTATFVITTPTDVTAAGLAISASFGGVTQSAWLIVVEPPPSGRQLASVTLASDLVVGGTTVQGTVTLASADGAATEVRLFSYNPSVATVPASVTVPAGTASAGFTVSTSPTTSADFAVLEASAGGITRSLSLTTVAPPTGPRLVSLVFFPNSVGGGGPVTGRATFSGPATDGAIVQLTSGNPSVVQVPSSVVVRKDTSSVDFPVTTSTVSANLSVSINATACCGGLGATAGALTVTTAAPPPADLVRIERAEFKRGGRGGTLTVRATSTSVTAILTVFRNQSTEPTFTLTNLGGGRYQGSFSFSGTKPQTVTVTSNLGGSATANVK
ncbi:MAG TPA: hypothetical protein VK524_02420 [Polyangiaceae bacterium]|nr:hypothetical protein [Polyangiaceae bacterium]